MARHTLVNGKYEVIPVSTLSGRYVTEVQIKKKSTGDLIALDPDLKQGEIFNVSVPGEMDAIESLLDLIEKKKEQAAITCINETGCDQPTKCAKHGSCLAD